MRLLISGASGFIGRAISRAAVQRGWQVYAISNRAAVDQALALEVRSLDDWMKSRLTFDVIVHAAAVRHRHWIPGRVYSKTNVELTDRVIALARARAGRLMHISSISVYGWPERLPIDETYPFAPLNPYAVSKVLSEEAVSRSDMAWSIIQPSITYGPGDTDGMVEKMFRMIARGFFVVPGFGSSRVQLVYIDDLANLTLDAAVSPTTLRQRFICTHRKPTQVRELIRTMARIVGRYIPPVGPPVIALGFVARLFEQAERLGMFAAEPPLTREKLATISVDRAYRIDHMVRLIGDEPRVSLDDGLKRTAVALGYL